MNKLSNTGKNTLTLVLLFFLFLVPLLFSWWYLNFSDVAKEGSRSNYGSLISPARPLPEILLVNAGNGKKRPLQGKWSLVYIVPGQCGEECKRILFSLDQIEQAMGKDSLRVQRVALVVESENTLQILSHYPELWFFQLMEQDADRYLKHFQLAESPDPVTAGHVFIVDPLGNLMMHYAPDFDPYGVLRDLRRLLKVSRIG